MHEPESGWGRPSEPTYGVKLFTASEANRALVLVKRIVADIVAEYHDLEGLREVLDTAWIEGSETRGEQAREDVVRKATKLRDCLEELQAVGVELKDFARGIVDFPAVADGGLVCLCWCHGEPKVAYWHELGEAFAERKSMKTLPTAKPVLVGKALRKAGRTRSST